ncbi:MAG: YopX family protein [Cyclobacteriaceae bacterium]
MNDFKPRKIKFKAWDKESRLLMRLNSIECNKGELVKKDHVLLQFTGLYDKDGEEIYDQDILMISLEKYIVFWNETQNGWYYSALKSRHSFSPLLMKEAAGMKRFCNYFELTEQP